MLAVNVLGLLAVSGLTSANAGFKRDSTTANSTTSAAAPTVTIYPETESSDPVVLTGTTSYGIDSYWGIPFAAPHAVWNTTTFNATTKPPACLQPASASYTGNGTSGDSEDCLYLNVQVPQGTNGSTAYPVIVWVYGGSFVSGSSAFYDGSLILTQGVATSKPVVYVSLNYRLGIFGFANGKEAAEAGAANLGLRDVQKALEWVQANIGAFGGDPDQVTVFGQSAGAILISNLYLQPNISLFKGAIMESGAQSTAPIDKTSELWQAPYDYLVEYANCTTSAANTTVTNTTVGVSTNDTTSSIDCLKALNATQLLAAQEQVQSMVLYSVAFPFCPSVDGDLIPDQPHTLIEEGKFAPIPYISGSCKDEGTGFVPISSAFNLSNPALIALALSSFEPHGVASNVSTELLTVLYPDDPSLGSPFGTGNETFGLSSRFKEIAAILDDAAFQAPRRWFQTQSVANNLTDVWSYFWNISAPSTKPYLGVPHSSEVPYVFGLPQVANLNISGISSLAAAYNFTEADVPLSEATIEYWLNFAYYTDPNGNSSVSSSNATYWPKYGTNSSMLAFSRSGDSVIADTYRSEQFNYFLSNPTVFNYRRSLHD